MQKTNKAILVSGFPGIGKSFLFGNSHLNISDSDSSNFPKDDFPKNYLQHIESIIDEKDIILISSHDIVRQALVDNGLHFVLVYPHKSLKEDYISRFKERGSPPAFIERLEEHWDEFIDQLEEQTGCDKIVLQKGEYLNDYADEILTSDFEKEE